MPQSPPMPSAWCASRMAASSPTRRKERMRTIWLGALYALLPELGYAAPRELSLADAVELAMHVDPQVAEARIGKDRSRLAVLRAQLDRITLKIDGSIAEQWNK